MLNLKDIKKLYNCNSASSQNYCKYANQINKHLIKGKNIINSENDMPIIFYSNFSNAPSYVKKGDIHYYAMTFFYNLGLHHKKLYNDHLHFKQDSPQSNIQFTSQTQSSRNNTSNPPESGQLFTQPPPSGSDNGSIPRPPPPPSGPIPVPPPPPPPPPPPSPPSGTSATSGGIFSEILKGTKLKTPDIKNQYKTPKNNNLFEVFKTAIGNRRENINGNNEGNNEEWDNNNQDGGAIDLNNLWIPTNNTIGNLTYNDIKSHYTNYKSLKNSRDIYANIYSILSKVNSVSNTDLVNYLFGIINYRIFDYLDRNNFNYDEYECTVLQEVLSVWMFVKTIMYLHYYQTNQTSRNAKSSMTYEINMLITNKLMLNDACAKQTNNSADISSQVLSLITPDSNNVPQFSSSIPIINSNLINDVYYLNKNKQLVKWTKGNKDRILINAYMAGYRK